MYGISKVLIFEFQNKPHRCKQQKNRRKAVELVATVTENPCARVQMRRAINLTSKIPFILRKKRIISV